ncbi:hypothetical protein DQ04_08851000 [Trypanosoma grayi]|uniref:hypothetical protein n=1 Tax=Trypanosoma grayi TaxID=71804 RepID=UPI0004F451A1|nr:hypothetical protein DQ04_08851000 [Trypanosoma grayi]KEG07777.1 hypothetical protein DQ04_08851000 [Trypanosoma grayi]
MALRPSIHACSVWPVGIDFDILRAYTAGYTVEETVMYMMQINAAESRDRSKKNSVSHSVAHLHNSPRGRSFECPRHLEDEMPLSSSVPVIGDNVAPETTTTTTTRMPMETTVMATAADPPPPPPTTTTTTTATISTTVVGGKQGEETVEKSTSETGTGDDVKGVLLALHNRSFPLSGSNLAFHHELLQNVSDAMTATSYFLHEDVAEQFNLIEMLRENYLSTPYAFLSSYSIPMTLRDRRRVVEVFYSVDDEVLKFFFGERMHKFEVDGESEGRFFCSAGGKRGNGLRKLTRAGLLEGSLRRQWENLKWVSTFLVSAYRGRDGILIPCTTPLPTALRQCFALRGSLGVLYATFVFGFEHRLTGRCWENLSYADCTSVCHVLASLWCDDSELMLREDFCGACARIARLLDENRVVAEMHQMAFAEAMRPRWQVQLNEVQRAISTNTGVGTSGGPHAASLASAAQPSPTTNVPPALLPRNTSTLPLDAETQSTLPQVATGSKTQRVSAGPCKAPSALQATAQTSAVTPSSYHAGSSNNNITGIPITGSTQALTTHNPHLSANGAFSRRFLLEFPFIIKCLVRMTTIIGNTGSLQEALEMFYTRVYLFLENLGYRSMHAQNIDANSPRMELHSPFTDSAGELDGGRSTSELKASVSAVAAGIGEDERDSSSNLAGTIVSENEEKSLGQSSMVVNGVVNTSLVVPTLVCATRRQSVPGSPRVSSSQNPSTFNFTIGSVNRKVYLRELCMFLSLLPNIFCNLTILTEEDHAVCDSDFSNFTLALKVLVQMHLASDDR